MIKTVNIVSIATTCAMLKVVPMVVFINPGTRFRPKKVEKNDEFSSNSNFQGCRLTNPLYPLANAERSRLP